jgi:Mitochondrial branched-chain alpha-ketoacid dehydrogenase kinase
MQEQSVSLAELPEIHSFLDGFYLSRIGIRMLIGQHVSLHEERRDGYIGAIHTQCDPREVSHQAIECAVHAWRNCASVSNQAHIRNCNDTQQHHHCRLTVLLQSGMQTLLTALHCQQCFRNSKHAISAGVRRL